MNNKYNNKNSNKNIDVEINTTGLNTNKTFKQQEFKDNNFHSSYNPTFINAFKYYLIKKKRK